jgi:hypothetical protein
VSEPDYQANIDRYLRDRRSTARYASFDFCFNYFQDHRESGRIAELNAASQIQTSCLQLGFYLASWGMFRGSSTLLTRSAKALEPVIDAVVEAPGEAWRLDVDGYSPEGIDLLLDLWSTFSRVLPGGHSATLVSKTLLGVFGCVPAFDAYFKRGFGASTTSRAVRSRSLTKVHDFYMAQRDLVERNRLSTLDFESGEPTERRYTQAKVIDMIFFIAGFGGPAA